MKNLKLETEIKEMLLLSGIHINGNRDTDITINNDAFLKQSIFNGSIGIGEAYMNNWWNCIRLDKFFTLIFQTNLEDKLKNNWKLLYAVFCSKIFNKQSKSHALLNIHKHYDIGNDVFENMLDKRMVYTCGYWKNASNLDEAQENKLDLTCQKLNLKAGMHILDIGCGWGSFAKFAAEKYGVKVTGITISEEQVELAKKLCAGLPIEIKLMDYRDINQKFDRIVSLGMFEHVGPKNYRIYMQTVNRCLTDDGLFLLHTIGSNTTETVIDGWINKYIFPGGILPSIKQIGQSLEGLFVMEDWHNFSSDYDKTLMAWHSNFTNNWAQIKNNYDETFFRMWEYYLLMCAASFRSRKNQLWQIVLSKKGVEGGIQCFR